MIPDARISLVRLTMLGNLETREVPATRDRAAPVVRSDCGLRVQGAKSLSRAGRTARETFLSSGSPSCIEDAAQLRLVQGRGSTRPIAYDANSSAQPVLVHSNGTLLVALVLVVECGSIRQETVPRLPAEYLACSEQGGRPRVTEPASRCPVGP